MKPYGLKTHKSSYTSVSFNHSIGQFTAAIVLRMGTSAHRSTCHCLYVDLQLDTYIVVIILIRQIETLLITILRPTIGLKLGTHQLIDIKLG